MTNQTLHELTPYSTDSSYSTLYLAPAGSAVFATSHGPLVRIARKAARCTLDGTLIRELTDLFKVLAVEWSELEHDNISPCLGLSTMSSGVPAFKIPFYPKGNVCDYINREPQANKSILIKDIAHGIAYLHSKNIIHANICPNNVMVDDSGRARLSDPQINFRVSQLLPRDNVPIPDAWSYKPKEQLTPTTPFDPTVQMDVYAFGSTVYHILSGKPPYPGGVRMWRGVRRIIEEGHVTLPKPLSIDEQYWRIIQKCWAQDPAARVTIAEVVLDLESFK